MATVRVYDRLTSSCHCFVLKQWEFRGRRHCLSTSSGTKARELNMPQDDDAIVLEFAPPPRERKKLDLTRDQREILRRQADRHRKSEKDRHVIEERRTTTGAGPREPRAGDRVPDRPAIEGRPVEVYRDEPPVREDRHRPSARDIPLIGPLFGPRDED